MTNLIYKLIFTVSILILLSGISIFGQQGKVNPFSVQSSTLLDDLKNLKIQNPKLTTEDLVKNANELLAKQGLNFVSAFNPDICQKIAAAKKNQKDSKSPVRLNAKLSSFEGDVTNIILPESQTDIAECGNCFVLLPVLEITSKDFVTIIQNRAIKFTLPESFIVNEISLVDTKSFSTIIKRWKIPFRSTPLSISEDGTMIFLNLPFEELSELTLIVYENGTFQFYAKKDVDLSDKGSLITNIPKESNFANASFISFGSGDKSKILKFNASCK